VRTGTSCRFFAVIVVLAALPAASSAAGLFDDPRSYFISADTVRATVSVSQTEIALDVGSASLFAVEALLRTGGRMNVGLAAEFPAIRTEGNLAYGIGDFRLSMLLRLAGDSLGASGFYLRAACRTPSGSTALAPFSYRSLDGSGGCELRGHFSLFAVRAAALFTLAGKRTMGEYIVHDNHVALAGALGLAVHRAAEATAFVSWTRFAGGAARQTLCLSFAIDVSSAIAVSIAAAAESGDGGTASFERFAGLTLAYRFPPRTAQASHPAAAP
jgi:hypothetical protein